MRKVIYLFLVLFPFYSKSQCNEFEYKTDPSLINPVTTVSGFDYQNNKFDWRKVYFPFKKKLYKERFIYTSPFHLTSQSYLNNLAFASFSDFFAV